jgi:hypothetical protein
LPFATKVFSQPMTGRLDPRPKLSKRMNVRAIVVDISKVRRNSNSRAEFLVVRS